MKRPSLNTLCRKFQNMANTGRRETHILEVGRRRRRTVVTVIRHRSGCLIYSHDHPDFNKINKTTEHAAQWLREIIRSQETNKPVYMISEQQVYRIHKQSVEQLDVQPSPAA